MRKTTLLRFLLVGTTFIFGLTSYGQTTINFDTDANWTKDANVSSLTSYGSHTYSESGVVITGTNFLQNTTTAQDGFAGAIGTYSLRIKNAAESKIVIAIATGGLADFSLKVRRWDNNPMPDYTVKYSVDGGSNWTDLNNINGDLLTTSDFFTYSSGTINSDVNNIQISIQNTGTTERIMVDDFTWTGYSSPNGVNNPSASNNKVYAAKGNLMVDTDADQTVEVYNATGQKLLTQPVSAGLNTISVQTKGLVFVKLGQSVSKVIL